MDRHAIPDIDLRETLARQGLVCHLLKEARDNRNDPSSGDAQGPIGSTAFADLLSDELAPLMRAAYDRELTPKHVGYETWGVTFSEMEAPHAVVAAATLQFVPDLPCFFHTHFEAVRPDYQGRGLGRLLYDCIAVWTKFLVLNDPLVLHLFLRANNDYYIVSTIDRDDDGDDGCDDNQAGHGAFLKKLGFVRAQHDFGQDTEAEIAFQRAFHLPVSEWFEAAQGEQPAIEENPPTPLQRTDSLLLFPLSPLSPATETSA